MRKMNRPVRLSVHKSKLAQFFDDLEEPRRALALDKLNPHAHIPLSVEPQWTKIRGEDDMMDVYVPQWAYDFLVRKHVASYLEDRYSSED